MHRQCEKTARWLPPQWRPVLKDYKGQFQNAFRTWLHFAPLICVYRGSVTRNELFSLFISYIWTRILYFLWVRGCEWFTIWKYRATTSDQNTSIPNRWVEATSEIKIFKISSLNLKLKYWFSYISWTMFHLKQHFKNCQKAVDCAFNNYAI